MVIIALSVLSGCAGSINAIENRNMTVKVNMTETIFLDAENLANGHNIYVRVRNTSDVQAIDFESLLKAQLTQRGLNVVNDPKIANFRVQANVLCMSKEKRGLTADGAMAGGFGGALTGLYASRGLAGNIAGAGIGGLVGAGVGALAGSLIHVDTYFGTIDVQIQEHSDNKVTGVLQTDAAQGSATGLHTTREVDTNWQTYRTRMVAYAKQTNIDENEAANAIATKLAIQVANVF